MLQKSYIFLIILLTLMACQSFEKRVPSEEDLLKKELSTINWNEVDEYPSVSECEKLNDELLRKQCFFDFMSQTIQEKLSLDSLPNNHPNLDTLEVKVTVFSNATLKFEPQFKKDTVAYDTIKIDSILHARLVGFPKVNPALKRGIPVKTQFVLPVIIKFE